MKMGKMRKKTSRQHKAAVEIASKRRELSKLLKREGFDGVPLAKKPKLALNDDEKVEEKKSVIITKEDRERQRREKLELRKKRSSLLLQRTRKGQPLMRNLVGNLVDKLSSENS